MRKIFSGQGRLPLFMGDGNLAESLDKNNRWYKLAESLPWAEMELVYISKLDPNRKGATNLPARLVLGAMLIQHIEKLTDRGTITAIQENPYMQYFVGLTHFTTTPVFDPSLFVTLRKRMSVEDINEISLTLLKKEAERKEEKRDDDEENQGSGNSLESSESESGEPSDDTRPTLDGAVIVDATCCPVEIPYPTDLRITYESILKLCEIRKSYGAVSKGVEKSIDRLREEAKKLYHSYMLRRNKPKGGLKRIMRQMLRVLDKSIKGFLKQFGEETTALLDALPNRQKRYISTILKVYEQQSAKLLGGEKMQARIVNIHQPHIRPIVRGKAGRKTEFGPKVNVSIVDGYAFIDHLSYESFNEGIKLEEQIRLYHSRFGKLPKKVLADRIYLNKANCLYMKENNITPIGKRLGRPPKEKKTDTQLKEMHQRNIVEGTFGTVKQRYGAEKLRTRLPKSTEVAVAMSFLAKNVMKFLRELLRLIFLLLFSAPRSQNSQPSAQMISFAPLLA